MNIKEQMQLLQIEDVTTPRQNLNGTITWKLPIKKYGKFIEVASFKSGYVRNNNSGYSNYQLNKRCDGEPEYFQLENGDYRRFSTRTCKLIPIEIDRLEYLISYCLKNYYIKRANEVTNSYDCGHYERIINLELQNEVLENKLKKANDQIKKLDDFYEASKTFSDSMYEGRDDRVKELEKEIERITENNYLEPLKELSVTVDGMKYKVI